MVRGDGRWVIDGQPRPVRADPSAAPIEAVRDRGAVIRCRRGPVARERVQICEVDLAGVVEVQVGIAAAGRILEALH